MQIKVSITDEEYELLKKRATGNLNSVSKEARLIIHQALYYYNPTTTQPITQPINITPAPFIYSPTVPTPPPVITSTYTPDPSASTIDISPTQPPETIPDYSTTPAKSEQKNAEPDIQATPSTQQPKPIKVIGGDEDAPAPTPKFAPKKLKSTLPVSTDLEIEQVDNEWDAECNEYSTEDFLFDLKNLEEKMREDSPFVDPTKDPDYMALKNYFIKHDLRERFRSLLSDPSRFYPEEGVYEQPQIRYAQAAFRKEKIDEEYIIALLSGTGDTYRATHHMKLYVDEM